VVVQDRSHRLFVPSRLHRGKEREGEERGQGGKGTVTRKVQGRRSARRCPCSYEGIGEGRK
jgi:hypothetical protein